jgi:outer membrane lipoprotein-sorting protein
MYRKILAGLALAALVVVPASAQTVDDIIAKNLQARGGLDKLKAVTTVRLTGTMSSGPGGDVSFVMEQKRPDMMRTQIVVQGATIVSGFDGQTAWQINPMAGGSAPQILPAAQAKVVAEQADFDGPLVDYKAKGNTIELVGTSPVDGRDAYKIKLTAKSGASVVVYIDAERFLEVRSESRTTFQGREVESESVLSDYRPEGGLMMPHVVEVGQKGSPQKMRRTIQKVELDIPIDDARFKVSGPVR